MIKRADVARMRPAERKALLDELATMVASGELHLGEAARVLRAMVLGMDRQTFAQVVRVSPRAIARLEDDPRANPTVETLTRVFAPFGGKVSLVFPAMTEPEPLREEQQQVRTAIRDALARTKRRRSSKYRTEGEPVEGGG
jgi:DNA-binding XRE family transcriptional regulator